VQCSSVSFQSDSAYIRHLQSCYEEQSRLQPGSSTGEESWQVIKLAPHDSNTTGDRNGDDHYQISGSDSGEDQMAARRRSHSGSEAAGGRDHLPQQQHDPLRSSSAASDEIDMAELDYYLEDSEEEEEVVYSNGEIARLLSLNEKDMQEEEEEDEDTGGEEEEITPVKARMEDEWTSSRRASSHGSAVESSKAPAMSKKKPASSPGHARAKEPVGVFWDIENCSVPLDKSAFAVASKFRKEFIMGKREAEFMCVCDITKERKEVMDDLNKAQVGGLFGL